MKDTLRNRFSREMTVRGLSQRTQDSYLLNVTLLVKRTGKHPGKLSTEDLRNYFAWMVNVHHVEPSTYRQHLVAVKLFFETVLKREEEFFDYASPKRRHKLPIILTVGETHRSMLNALRVPRIWSAAVVGYSCGLRKSEIVCLSVDWISAEAGSLHIHNAKGGVDRVVPLPKRTLCILRDHWQRERPSGRLLFESGHRPHHSLSGDTLRKALKAAAETAGINRSVCLHTLRHGYVSHLMEYGVPLPLIQRWMGHKSITTTMVYTQVTPSSLEHARRALDRLTEAL